jgi:hypothetical protein
MLLALTVATLTFSACSRSVMAVKNTHPLSASEDMTMIAKYFPDFISCTGVISCGELDYPLVEYVNELRFQVFYNVLILFTLLLLLLFSIIILRYIKIILTN